MNGSNGCTRISLWLAGLSADSYSKLEPPFYGSALHSRTCDVIFSNVSCWDTRTSSDRQKISPAQQTRTSSGVPAANIGNDDITCSAVQRQTEENLEYETGLTSILYKKENCCWHAVHRFAARMTQVAAHCSNKHMAIKQRKALLKTSTRGRKYPN